MKTPDEIKRYQKIISNKDAILEDAQTKADAIIADANAQAQKIVSESEVMQTATAAVQAADRCRQMHRRRRSSIRRRRIPTRSV